MMIKRSILVATCSISRRLALHWTAQHLITINYKLSCNYQQPTVSIIQQENLFPLTVIDNSCMLVDHIIFRHEAGRSSHLL
jgi:hypothetical protein